MGDINKIVKFIKLTKTKLGWKIVEFDFTIFGSNFQLSPKISKLIAGDI